MAWTTGLTPGMPIFGGNPSFVEDRRPGNPSLARHLVAAIFHIGCWHQRKQILEQLERSFGRAEVVNF